MRLLAIFRTETLRKRLRRFRVNFIRLGRTFGPRSQVLAVALLAVWGGFYFESVRQRQTNRPQTLGAFTQRVNKLLPDSKLRLPDDELTPVLYRISTQQPVVFLTIDDGHIKDRAGLAYMREKGLVATLFLNDPEASEDYSYFKELVGSGSKIQNHTVSHEHMNQLSYEQQKQDICDNADRFGREFGERPNLFRPPFGEFSELTQMAAKQCGMKALVMWSASVNNGIVTYRNPGGGLQPGDIILLHFRPTMVQDLKGAEAEIAKAGLQVGLLEDWLE